MELRRSDATPIPPGEERPFLPYLDLRQRLQALVFVRFLVVIAIVLGALFASHVVGIEALDVGALCMLAGALFLCNAVTFLIIRPYRHDHESAQAARAFLELVLHFTVTIDFLGLTVALWLVGGASSPFKAFFIFNVIIASVFLSRRAAFAHAFLAFALLSGLVIGMWQDWIPGHYPEGAISGGPGLSGEFVFTVLVVQGLLILLTALLMTYLMGVLRQSAQQLVDTNRKLERLSQLRRDFLHIALHNLRSPVGAVSMHISNMINGYGGPLEEIQQQWMERSQYRLEELTRFLHDLECLASLETDDLNQHAEIVDIGEVVEGLVTDNQDLVTASDHQLTLEKTKASANVRGVPRLIREALANYVTNAIKYTPKGGQIAIRLLHGAGVVRVEVEDSGIGITEKDQKRLFREMVRIQHNDPALGDVKGSGLGLYIVKRIAETHSARIDVESRPGEGSIFSIEFPTAESIPANPDSGMNDSGAQNDA